MLSCFHNAEDDRIYWKESVSLQSAGYEVVHICLGDRSNEYTTKEGIRIIEVTMKKAIPVNWKIRLSNLLAKALETKADFYHMHDWPLHALRKELKNAYWKPKLIFDAHDCNFFMRLQGLQYSKKGVILDTLRLIYFKFIDIWEKRNSKKYDAFITPEEFNLHYYTHRNSKQKKLIVANYSFFELIESVAEKKEYDIIYSGLIEESRGILQLIDAIKICAINIPEIKVLIIGNIHSLSFKEKLERKISLLQLSNNIILHEAVPFNEIEKHYRMSKTGILIWLPTKKNQNAIPIKLFEYMAFGLPVIFTKKGVASNIVSGTQCGILADPEDPISISVAIETLLMDHTLYTKYSQNGLKAVREKYNWSAESVKLIQLYKELN